MKTMTLTNGYVRIPTFFVSVPDTMHKTKKVILPIWQSSGHAPYVFTRPNGTGALKVLKLIHEQGTLRRRDVVWQSHLTKATVGAILYCAQAANLVVSTEFGYRLTEYGKAYLREVDGNHDKFELTDTVLAPYIK